MPIFAASTRVRMKSCVFLILTYKGQKHLEHLLPSVRAVAERTPGYRLRTLVVDNGRHEPTRDYVRRNFPEVEYEFSPANDYLFALNPYLRALPEDYVFVLNDDIRLHPDVLRESLPLLDADPSLLGVTCHIRDWDDGYTAATVRKLGVRRGWLFSHWKGAIEDERPRYTLYCGGGAAIFRTRKINALGGFDPLFRPAYCEDLDLGHKAWHRGWPSVFAPKALLYHREGGTIGEQFARSELSRKIYTNQILWMARDGRHPGFLAAFLLMLPYRLLTGWKVYRDAYAALWRALRRLPKALWQRRRDPRPVLDDRAIMRLLDQPWQAEGGAAPEASRSAAAG